MGDRRLRARVEAYSCKHAGEDKKLAKTLEQQYVDLVSDVEYGGSFNSSPFGKLSDPGTRRLLINLICTMNATFPDYDFSTLRQDQFVQENTGMVVNSVNRNLNDIVTQYQPNFLEELWGAINSVISMRDSLVFSYVPDTDDGDPFSVPGAVWSFNHFFFNKTEKKIVFFTCTCVASRVQEFYGEEDMNENESYSSSEEEIYELEMEDDEM